jgi:hypothetical protein
MKRGERHISTTLDRSPNRTCSLPSLARQLRGSDDISLEQKIKSKEDVSDGIAGVVWREAPHCEGTPAVIRLGERGHPTDEGVAISEETHTIGARYAIQRSAPSEGVRDRSDCPATASVQSQVERVRTVRHERRKRHECVAVRGRI